jgi:hypothetical protein
MCISLQHTLWLVVTQRPQRWGTHRLIPAAGRGGSHTLHNWLTDAVLTTVTSRQAALYPQENSWYSFLLEAETTPGPSAAGRIRSTEKSDDLVENGTLDLPACGMVPRPAVQVGRYVIS